MQNTIPEQGDIIYTDLSPQAGHEQKGQRPVIVLSPFDYNQKAGLCVIAPITTKESTYPFYVPIDIKGRDSFIISDQFKSIDYKARGASFVIKSPNDVLQKVLGLVHLLTPIPKN